MKITVYTTTSSESSKELKDYLKQKQVDFEEKIIDLDEFARKEMALESDGFLGVPFVVFLEGERKEKVVGFDKRKIDAILER